MTSSALLDDPSTADAARVWATGVLERNPRAAGRAISLIENDDLLSEEIVLRLYPRTGQAYAVGFTGPPGAGKSTLVDGFIQLARSFDHRVGVIAVDPNSPFTGGAILGDRIRMMRHNLDTGVFIRSMGTRGHLGGLTLATSRAMLVLDAFGMDFLLLETVGVGQSELEVTQLADTTVVVLMPGLGDSVQSIKAGIMEIADIFVVNKADHPAVQKTVADLEELLRLDGSNRAWTPPIVRTIGTREEGLPDVWDAVGRHRSYLESSGELQSRRKQRLEHEIIDIATRRLREHMLIRVSDQHEFQSIVDSVAERQLDPFTAARRLVERAVL